MRRILARIARSVLPFFMPLLAPVFRWVAYSGVGSEACLKNGFLPVPVHYYHPIPDLADLERRGVWDRRSDLAGIDFRPVQQVSLLKELGGKYGAECDWPPSPTSDPLAFHTENNSFSFGCAASLHTIIRNYKPARILEIGSGNSSKVISAALRRNAAEGAPAEYTILDPYPSDLVRGLPALSRLVAERVELTEIDQFRALGENDILFIDSGHTVRTGGDVNFLYLDVLPRLAPGVIIHVHDIPLPYEYPQVYFTNPSFRVFWTEAYLLQAFLSLNPCFEIMLAMNYLTREHWDAYRAAFPHLDPAVHKATSGSFWMRRIT